MGFRSRDEAHAYYLANREHMLRQQKQRRQALIAAGLCPQCGFRKKTGDNHIRCDYCRLRWVVNRDVREARKAGLR